jgi:hypothetical protein
MATDNLSEDILKALACLNMKSSRGYIDTEARILHLPQHNISISTNQKNILFKRGAANLYNSGKLSGMKLVKVDPKVVTYFKFYSLVVKHEPDIATQINDTILTEPPSGQSCSHNCAQDGQNNIYDLSMGQPCKVYDNIDSQY